MPDTIHVEIYTPLKKYLMIDVDFISVQSDKYRLGITPHHAEMISTIAISYLELRSGDDRFHYAVGKGIIHVEKMRATILVDTVEEASEIDLERAKAAKNRAEKRLADNTSTDIDRTRAEEALLRANTRINVASSNSI
ncbi:MAG: ATP synthase F1 subunit epsilon [Coprobacillus sp.]|nr:ATP synthase F1 subunit epsilon [Coprobacillus sp.]